jgi:hypothetical protein
VPADHGRATHEYYDLRSGADVPREHSGVGLRHGCDAHPSICTPYHPTALIWRAAGLKLCDESGDKGKMKFEVGDSVKLKVGRGAWTRVTLDHF